MSDIKTVAIERFASEQQAATAAAWLEADGIVAFIDGAAASTALSYYGVGTVKLMVSQSLEQAALDSLATYRQQIDSSSDWYCSQCHETNEGSFDLCWKCQGDRDDVAAEFPRPTDNPEQGYAEVESETASNSDNPYEPARAKLESTDAYSAQQAEDAIHRAYRSAVLSFKIPILFTPFSLVLLLASCDCNQTISSKSRREWWLACFLNLLAVCLWAVVIILGSILL